MPPLPQNIRNLIGQQGAIPFARFMDLALYCPDYGFYEKEKDNVGHAGDFYTSVSVGPLFGELLAFQFSRWFDEGKAGSGERGNEKLRIVEAGAHDGKLAGDILRWFQRQRPELFQQLEYCPVEPSPRRREWQRQTLAEFTGQVKWIANLPGAEKCDPRITAHASRFTILFANELLDAMPLHRFGWDASRREWFEWGVTTELDRFVWTRMAFSNPLPGEDGVGLDVAALLPSAPKLLEVLPDGYTIECSPAAERWWSAAAQGLNRGKLLTFDYGFGAGEAISPERPKGTLRAYRNHKIAEDVLANPGEQDITAHVNFERIERAGVAAGLRTELTGTQGRFLTRLAAEAWKPGAGFSDWNQKRTRQFQTLTHPQHLGQSFRVLIQSRS